MKIKNKNFAVVGICIAAIGLLGAFQDVEGAVYRAVVFCIAGGILVFVSTRVPEAKKSSPKKNPENAPVAKTPKAPSGFPDFDDTGHRRLALVEYSLTGVTHSHFGSDPQKFLQKLKPGDKLILHADPQNSHDANAVWVSNSAGKYLGWIPSGYNLEIFQRLTNGETVLARVKRTYWVGIDDESEASDEEIRNALVGCEIEIARYSKAKVKEPV